MLPAGSNCVGLDFAFQGIVGLVLRRVAANALVGRDRHALRAWNGLLFGLFGEFENPINQLLVQVLDILGLGSSDIVWHIIN